MGGALIEVGAEAIKEDVMGWEDIPPKEKGVDWFEERQCLNCVRLRKALQEIINTPYLGAYNDPTIHNIARKALEDK